MPFRRVWITPPWPPARMTTLTCKLTALLSQASNWRTIRSGQKVLHSFVTFLPANLDPLLLLVGDAGFSIWSMVCPTPQCAPHDSSLQRSSSGMGYESRWGSGLRPAFLAKPPRSRGTSEHHSRHSTFLIAVLTTSTWIWWGPFHPPMGSPISSLW